MKLPHFILYLLQLIFCYQINGQTVFQDNFSDGDFINNPTWSGDVTKYIVTGAYNELRLNDLGNSGSASLYVPINIQDSTVWEFLINTNLSTAGPSTANRIRVFLHANTSNFASATLNGYYLQIGETGSLDAVEIYKVSNGTSTRILRGTDATVAGPVINSRIRIVRNNAGLWELFTDHTGNSNFTSEGTVTDNTHNSGTYFGVSTTYTTTQGDRFFYDDFNVSPLFVDNVPPVVLSATAVNANTVDVLFNEALSPASSNLVSNYAINNGINITSANLDAINPALIHLTVSNLSNLTTYQLDITDIEDLNNNVLLNQSLNFTYQVFITPNFQELIFNEIMIDPNPVVNLPDAEYIELFNRSNGVIDLNGYSIIHRSASSGIETIRTLGSYVLLPGEYVLLHNTTDYQSLNNGLVVNSFPALNNTSAFLILKNANGDMVDSILYNADWYQDTNKDNGGWSLELINPNLVCKNASNWIASNSIDGGTPGSVNSVLDNIPDTLAPKITHIQQLSVNQIYIIFDDILDPLSAINISNYSISPFNQAVFARLMDEYTVEITFAANFMSDTTYSLTALGVKDCIGNSDTTAIYFEYLLLSSASHYDIIINEILSDVNPSVGLPEKEFVELYNRSNKNINLAGFRFSDETSSVAIFPYYILKPKQYLIIQKSGAPDYNNFGNVLEFDIFPDLDATEDLLVLSDNLLNVIDAVEYSNDWHSNSSKAEGGWSLERINPNKPCEGFENWSSSVAQPPLFPTVGGSPGQANSILQTIADNHGPELLRAYPYSTANSNNGDSIRLFFSESVGDSSSLDIVNYSINNGLSLTNVFLESPGYNTVIIVTNNALVDGLRYTIRLSNGFRDCIGNPIFSSDSAVFAKPSAIESEDIVVNEILFNPVSGGSDYLEIYNNTANKVLNIGDLWISNTSEQLLLDANDVKTDYLLFPGDYVVLTPSPLQVYGQYNIAGASIGPNLNKMIKFTLPGFDDKNGTVIIYTVNNNQAFFIDSLYYSEDYQSPLIDDLNGIALERIDFNAPSMDKYNWHSAAQAVKFGTPTYRNSSAYSNEITEDGVIQLPTNTLSPDGDGFEDFLLINYNIDAIGYVGNFAIYDAQGRFVKQLVNNELLMQEGTIQWDGSNESGEKCLVGPYIIFAEIFNPEGKVKRYKKTCILAAKF